MDFWVYGMPFLHTIYNKLNLKSIQAAKNYTMPKIKKGLNLIVDIYMKRIFIIDAFHCDNGFDGKKLQLSLSLSILYICATNEFIKEVKHSIYAIKEHIRCSFNNLPYHCFPKRLMINLVKCNEYFLVLSPSK